MKTIVADSKVRRIVVLAAVNVMLVAVGWLMLVSPQRHHAAAAAQQAQTVQSQLAQIEAATTPVAPKQPKIRTAGLYVLDHAMPVTEDMPDLLLTVDQLAGDAGVQVTALSPSTPAQQVGYTSVPISLTVTGTYQSITSFMHRLETLVTVQHGTLLASGRLFSVTEVSISPGASGHNLTGTLAVDAYVFGAVTGATPLPTTAPAETTTGTTGTSTTTASG